MLVRKISHGHNFHGKTILDGFIHIPVMVKVDTPFFDLLRKTSGSFIHGHFVHADDDLRSDTLNFDFILIRTEILNGESCCGKLAMFNLYIIETVYYRKIDLPDQFTMHFILNIAKDNEKADMRIDPIQGGTLHAAIIPGVLR